jgi:hypothetical protein
MGQKNENWNSEIVGRGKEIDGIEIESVRLLIL